MTEEEQNKMMGATVAQLAEVRAEVERLRGEADGYLKVLARASAKIREGISNDLSDDTLPDPKAWPTVEQIDVHCRAISAARTRQHKLTIRLREWGVID